MHEIIALDRQGLHDYVHSSEYQTDDFVAITPHRAASQMRNPLVQDEDILLLMIRSEGKLWAYLGMMPGYVYYGRDRSEIVTWLTCLWVADGARGQRLSEKLLVRASEICGNKMLLGDYVPFTKKIYDRSGLFIDEIYSKRGLRWYIKADLASILAPKHRLFMRFRKFITVGDLAINVLLTLRQKAIRKPKISYDEITTLGPEEMGFIDNYHRDVQFRRSAQEINWMLAHPWVISGNVIEDPYQLRYFFSSSASDFQFRTFVMRDTSNDIVAIAIFSKRDGMLKLPYYFFKRDVEDIVGLIHYTVLLLKVNTFTTYDEILAQSLKKSKSSIPIFTKEIQRNYRLANYFANKIKIEGGKLMQDGEGDCGFT